MPNVYDIADQFRAQLLAGDARAAAEMVRFYRDAYKDIQIAVDKVLAKIQQSTKAAKPIEGLAKHAADLHALQSEVERGISRYAANAAKYIQAEQALAVEQAQWQAMALTEAAMGTPPAGAIGASVRARWHRLPDTAVQQLVGSLQPRSPLTDLFAPFGREAAQTVRRELVSGLVMGKHSTEIARGIRGALDGNVARALTIARTEKFRAYREAARASYIENASVVKGWQWMSAMNSRCCFPAGTMVRTRRGNIAIECVAVGDEVLTHSGKWQRVSETMCRNYSDVLVTIEAGGKKVTATSEHPFLVKREGKLEWVEALNLRRGDRVVCDMDGGVQVSGHRLSDGAVEGRIRQSKNFQPERLQVKRLASILLSCLLPVVPVNTVNLNDHAHSWQVEVNRIAPAWEKVLLLIGDVQRVKALAGVALRLRFPRKAAVAPSRAEMPTTRLTRLYAKLFAAGKTRFQHRRAAALFRTITLSPTLGVNELTARLTGAVSSRDILARLRAPYRVASARVYPEDRLTLRADLLDPSRSLATFKGAIGPFLAAGSSSERVTTMLAYKFLCRLWRGLSRPAMRMRSLISAVAGCLTKTSPTSSPSSGYGKGSTALLTSPFHTRIISQVAYHFQELHVYNIEVEQDHSYIANGFVVHNCAMCVAMHGTIHKLDERFASHPNCRCTPVPLTRSWDELGFPGVSETVPEMERGTDAFVGWPESAQREVLGPAAFSAYRAGAVRLSDFVGEHTDPRWGAGRHTRSLRSILGPDRAEAYTRLALMGATPGAAGKYDATRRMMLEAATGARALSAGEITSLHQHVAAVGFDPNSLEKARGRIAGFKWQGKTLVGRDMLPPADVHYIWHVLKRREWPAGTTQQEYIDSLAEIVLDENTGIFTSRLQGTWQVGFVGRSGKWQGPDGYTWSLVEYRLETGYWITGHQLEDGLRSLYSLKRSEMRWLRRPK